MFRNERASACVLLLLLPPFGSSLPRDAFFFLFFILAAADFLDRAFGVRACAVYSVFNYHLSRGDQRTSYVFFVWMKGLGFEKGLAFVV